MSTKDISVLVILILVAACASNPFSINNFNKRQDRLEAEVEKLSSELAESKIERDKRISLMQQDIESIARDYSSLKKKLDSLGKQTSTSDPASAKSPDNLYSSAESFYHKRKYEEAIIAYQKFIDANPKDNRVPDSYLKQGISLIKLGRKKEARYFLQTIIDKYPESSEAKIAKVNLKILNE
ncbi:MAG: tetratricopeptide repeat protein [Thermodesulfobacteriota bacterium]